MIRKCTVLLLGAVLSAIPVIAVTHSKHTHLPAKSPAIKDVVTKTVAHPSATQPTSKNYTPTAAPNEPSYISLPTIGAQGFIQKVGVDQYSQMAAPNNVHLAGWYINSLLPGQSGLSIIDGHVDGYAHNQGIFGQINRLHAGDVFTITFGNGSHKTFMIKRLQLVDTANVPSVLFAHDPSIISQLNLITCGGDYDNVSHTYDKRIIAISALVP